MPESALLYVIGPKRGPHKVGLSIAPARRLRELQVGSPQRLILKRTSRSPSDDAEAVEAYAHWLLRESAVRGEWFRVTEEAAWVALIAASEAVAEGRASPRIGGKQRLPDVMTVRFGEGVFDRVDAVAGKNRRAQFIREVVEAELTRRERVARKPSPPQPKP